MILTCGNCLDILKNMPSESVDMVMTSPPYDNLREYHGYSFDFENVAKELYRVVKKGGGNSLGCFRCCYKR
jgi:site-specific DNA-methyltransferase (adenine-specific)